MRRIVAVVFAVSALAVIATPGAGAQEGPSENANCAAQYVHFFGPPRGYPSTVRGTDEFPFGLEVVKHIAVEHGRGTLAECLVEVP
jgi:hypothetical protein